MKNVLKKVLIFNLILIVYCGTIDFNGLLNEKAFASTLVGDRIISEVFTDSIVAEIIAQTLEKTTVNDSVSQGELDTITSIQAKSKNISSIAGLQYLRNIENIDLSFNRIPDISPLTNMTKLTTLDLSYNCSITDFTPIGTNLNLVNLNLMRSNAGEPMNIQLLSNLKNLEKLNVSWNQINNIESLSGLTKLRELDISKNFITNSQPIVNLIGLEKLDFSDNFATVDLSKVASLTQLVSLNLRGNNLNSIIFLSGLNNLRSLDLSDNPIVNFLSISSLTNLTELFVWKTQLSDVTPFLPLVNLETLDLHWNNITDLSPFENANMSNLKKLYLNQNFNLVNISYLSGFTNLESLDLGGNNKTDINSFSNLSLPHLGILKLSACNLSDISKLSRFTELIELELAYNHNISDVSPLAGMTKLQRLLLIQNRIVDISPLRNLRELKIFNAAINQIEDISILEHMSQLEELYLDNNEITSLIPLYKLNRIKLFELNNNKISSLNAFAEADMPFIKEIGLGNNLISDLNPFLIANISNIESLNLRDNRIADVTPLKGLPNQCILVIWGNNITSGLNELYCTVRQQNSTSIQRYLGNVRRGSDNIKLKLPELISSGTTNNNTEVNLNRKVLGEQTASISISNGQYTGCSYVIKYNVVENVDTNQSEIEAKTVFTDDNGRIISAILDQNNVKIRINVTNNSCDPTPVILMAALYSPDNKFLKIQSTKQIQEPFTTGVLRLSLDISSAPQGGNIKVFVWDSLENARPLQGISVLN